MLCFARGLVIAPGLPVEPFSVREVINRVFAKLVNLFTSLLNVWLETDQILNLYQQKIACEIL